MLDHVSFAVNDYEQSLKFYDETLKVLGYTREITLNFPDSKSAGYGNGGVRPCLWIVSAKPFVEKSTFSRSLSDNKNEIIGNAQGVHFAFSATSTNAIDEWYKTCLRLGANDNGPPGPRAHYHQGYYGAFVTDPNGWRIEACFHQYRV